ncbi:MAG: hypothetical protein RL708_1404 [Bacteroidota bacterium]|jgi:hypothetical protein
MKLKHFILAATMFFGTKTFAQVGIGTTSPVSTLDVRGSASFNTRSISSTTTLTGTDHTIIYTGSSTATLTLPSASACSGREIWVKNSSTYAVTIATASSQTIDGNSTWSIPSQYETVLFMSNGTNWIVKQQMTPSNGNADWKQGGNTQTAVKNLGTTGAYDLPIVTNNTERMRILSGGNVGIATTTPGSELDVKGTLRLSGSSTGYVGLKGATSAGSTTYTLPTADGSSGQVLSTNGSGTLSWATAAGSTTNTMSSSANTITSTVNGTSATASAVNSISNTSSTNSLSTTVNGISSSAVNIINSNTLSSSGNTITNSVNGVSATANAVNTVANTSSANTLLTTINGVAGTAVNIINTNATSLSGNNLTTTINGVASTALDLKSIDSSIYKMDGTLRAARTVTMNANNLTLSSTTGHLVFNPSSTGKFGIGITTPAVPMNVHYTTAAAPASSGTTSTAIARFDAQNNALDIGAYSASPYGNWLQATAVANLATTQPLVLNPNGGNIGIGVASPSYALSFSGQAAKQIWMERNTTSATAGNDLTLQSSGCTSSSTNKAGGNLYLNSGTSTGTGTSDVYIGTATAGTSGTTDNSPSTKMYIKGNGMVGLGHSSPTANLSIYGTTNSGFAPTCWGGTSTGPEISFSRGGFYTVGASIQMIDYNAYSSGLSFNVHKGTNNGGGGTFADNWPTDVVQAMTIDNKGYVGVGVADPKSTLDVGGSLALKISTQSSSIAVTLDNTATIWYFTGTASILLPLASSYTNRVYTIVNRTGSSKTISSFTSLSGSATISIAANSSIEIVSNGTSWLQIR